jgi:Fic family protein
MTASKTTVLTERQNEIVGVFLENPDTALSVGQLMKQFDVDRSTLFRDLAVLSKLAILKPDAPTRARTYTLDRKSNAYLEWDLSRPKHARQPVSYDPRLLESYAPNRTFLLTQAQREQLAKAGTLASTPSGARLAKAGKTYQRILATLLIDLSYASSNLEGVPISWLDTKTLLEFGEKPKGLNDLQMRIVLNHKQAINFVAEHAKDMTMSRRDLLDIHSLLTKDLIQDRSAIGDLRQRVVMIDDSQYTPPDNPHILREAFEKLCQKASKIKDPFEQAFFIMAFLPYLQPFQDGNKRVSRLAMNVPLIKNHLAPFSFTDIAKRDYILGLLAFYERGRHEFLARAFVGAYAKTGPRYAKIVDFVGRGGIVTTITTTPPTISTTVSRSTRRRKP